MKLKAPSRHFLSVAIIIFYLLPLFFLSAYSMGWMPQAKSWTFLSFGLMIAALGSLCLMLILYYWEEIIRHSFLSNPNLLTFVQSSKEDEKNIKITPLDASVNFSCELPLEISEDLTAPPILKSSIKITQEEFDELEKKLLDQTEKFLENQKENLELQAQIEKITQDFADYKLFSEEQLKQKQIQLQNYQQLSEDHRFEMEKRQEHIHQLDSKIHDLSYEIKTLLYLNQEESFSALSPYSNQKSGEKHRTLKQELPNTQENGVSALKEKGILITEIFGPENTVRSSQSAFVLLKKLVDMAEKITGANRYGTESSRYREFSSYYTFDQRRLFDLLKNETSALIVVCTPKEHKALFVNNQVNQMLGWSPEKFIANFSSVLEDSMHEWQKALELVATSQDLQTRVLAKTKEGTELFLGCCLTTIPTGLFRNYVIAVLYPS